MKYTYLYKICKNLYAVINTTLKQYKAVWILQKQSNFVNKNNDQ